MSKLGEWDNKLLIENFKMLQDKLSQKEKLLDEAITVMEYYKETYPEELLDDDRLEICSFPAINVFGKRARSFLEKVKELEG